MRTHKKLKSKEQMVDEIEEQMEEEQVEEETKHLKRPESAYILFYKEVVAARQVNVEGKKEPISNDMKKEIGQRWKDLPKEERERYEIKARPKFEAYVQQNRKLSKGKKKEKNALGHRCTPNKVKKIIGKLTDEQKTAVKNMGFGGLLSLQCTVLTNDLCKWLVNNFDPDHSCLQVHGRKLVLSPLDVEKILGFTNKGVNVDLSGPHDDLNDIWDKYFRKKREIELKNLEIELDKVKVDCEAFRIFFVLYIVGTLFSPSTKPSVNFSFLRLVKDTNSVSTYNWAKFIYETLVQSVRKYQDDKLRGVGGCILLLEIFYFERVTPHGETVNPFVSRPLPRIEDWTDAMIRKRIKVLNIAGGFSSNEVLVDVAETISYPVLEIIESQRMSSLTYAQPVSFEYPRTKNYEQAAPNEKVAMDEPAPMDDEHEGDNLRAEIDQLQGHVVNMQGELDKLQRDAIEIKGSVSEVRGEMMDFKVKVEEEFSEIKMVLEKLSGKTQRKAKWEKVPSIS